ncbi:MAG: RtcB family protein [Candidatus Hydrogenedens sp.]|jgi:tRNA-splicing ligase RtcB|nr:RtcB family protein [Candidatus Hydrogenedens sp.]
MTQRLLTKYGIRGEAARNAARKAIHSARQAGWTTKKIQKTLRQTVQKPQSRLRDPIFSPLAQLLAGSAAPASGKVQRTPDKESISFAQWGTDIDPAAIRQMHDACSLPVAVKGALMPDAHVGYGLPIGGVLATDDVVIPYAVGVDIACRMKLSVFDMPVSLLDDTKDTRLKEAVEQETRFGIGANFKKRRSHKVMDEDWSVSPVTKKMKDTAWSQLGTSGSGNHFVEFGTIDVYDEAFGVEPGCYLALLSHSGSRGTGAEVCKYYSARAQSSCKELPRELMRLSWLDLKQTEGRDYWKAMELMGRYSAANHELIHRHIAERLGAQLLFEVENHHNFAWREVHDGRRVVVHRKGATPARKGQAGIIPGSMASPAYVVHGLGNEDSLCSASHGAGRNVSRTRAKKMFSWHQLNELLEKNRVTLLSAGLDESPMAYKNIEEVMAAQGDLAEIKARFFPRLVKMAPAGERPED